MLSIRATIGSPPQFVELFRPQIGYLLNEIWTPEIFDVRGLLLDLTELIFLVPPIRTLAKPVADISRFWMLDVQYVDGGPLDRIAQSFRHLSLIQHRFASRKDAYAFSVELADQVPQRSPCTGVTPTVGQLVKAVDCQLNHAAPNQGNKLVSDKICAQTGQRCVNPVIESRQHFSKTLDMKKQGLRPLALVRIRRRPLANDPLDQKGFPNPGRTVDDIDTKIVGYILEHMRRFLERKLLFLSLVYCAAPYREKIPRLAGFLVEQVLS